MLIAMEAAGEISGVADTMLRDLSEAEPLDLARWRAAERLKLLAGLVVGALGDPSRGAAYLRQRLTGNGL